MRTQRFGAGWAFTLSPARVRDLGLVIGEEATVELAPEGPENAEWQSKPLGAGSAARPAPVALQA